MNKKGFAISIILYSMVFLLISIFYMLLGIVKTRYIATTNLRKDVLEELNDSGLLYDKIMRLCDNPNSTYVEKYNSSNGSAIDTPNGTGGKDICYYTTTSSNRNSTAEKSSNVIFGDFCWQIVRTTADGGVKLIYNGLKTSNNKCPSDAASGYSSNPRPSSRGFVGVNGTTVNLSGNKLYGRGFTYSGTTFTLTDTFTANWTNDWLSLLGTYTCLNTSSSCTTLYYVGNYQSETTAGVAGYTLGTLDHYSQIGKSAYNTYTNNLTLSGYMYNEMPRIISRNMSVATNVIERDSSPSAYYYGDTATWDGTKYNLKLNGSTPTSTSTWANIRESALGKYTCKSSTATSCETVYYIAANSTNSYMYNIPLSNNESITTKSVTWKTATAYTKSGNNYVLTSPTTKTILLKDWYANYESYRNFYVCPDYTSTTCSDLGYVNTTNNYLVRYDLMSNNYIFGYSVSYSGGNYTIDNSSDTEKYQKIWDWYQKYNTINKSHYTCFKTDTNSCGDTVYYVFYTTSDVAYYIKLTGGDLVDTALDKMLNTTKASVNNVNKYDSAIKALIDNWYKKNIDDKSLTSYLDSNAVFCNDRGIKTLYGWTPTGSTTSYIRYNTYTAPTKANANLGCTNITDRFSVNNTLAPLTYPVGLLTTHEERLMNTGYVKTGQNWWVATPYNYSTTQNNRYVKTTGATDTTAESIITAYGVRPVIVLKPGIEASGKGTYDRPYIINTD